VIDKKEAASRTPIGIFGIQSSFNSSLTNLRTYNLCKNHATIRAETFQKTDGPLNVRHQMVISTLSQGAVRKAPANPEEKFDFSGHILNKHHCLYAKTTCFTESFMT